MADIRREWWNVPPDELTQEEREFIASDEEVEKLVADLCAQAPDSDLTRRNVEMIYRLLSKIRTKH